MKTPNQQFEPVLSLRKLKKKTLTLCARQLIINKLLELAWEEKKVYVCSYSKGLIGAICQAF